ncbi:hypothetical protein GJ496_005154 [Pomphorhynchus laevis]|nr:hypothetical protein GJ496_005154 [Pomphorhynchus laevis]
MGNRQSYFTSVMDLNELKLRVGLDRYSMARSYFRMLAFPLKVIDKNTIENEVIRKRAPSYISQAIYDLLTTKNGGVDFKSLFSFLLIITEGTDDETDKLAQDWLSVKVLVQHGITMDIKDYFKENTDSTAFLSLLKAVYDPSRKPDAGTTDFERIKDIYGDSTLFTRRSENSFATVYSEFLELYDYLVMKTEFTRREIIEMESKYLQLTEEFGYKFSLSNFQSVMSPPVDSIVSEALFNALDTDGNELVGFVELIFGCHLCCSCAISNNANFLLRYFDCGDDKEKRKELISECERMFKVKIGVLKTDQFTISNLCHALDAPDTILLFLVYLQQIFHLFFGLRYQTRETETQNITTWLSTNGNSALREGEDWYIVDMKWINKWEGKQPLSAISNHSHKLTKRLSYQVFSNVVSNTLTKAKVQRRQSSLTSNLGLLFESIINNTGLINTELAQNQDLFPGEKNYQIHSANKLVKGYDYKLLPYPVWAYLRRTYGGGPILRRYVIINKEGSLEIEIYRVVVKVYGDLNKIQLVKSHNYFIATMDINESSEKRPYSLVPLVSSVSHMPRSNSTESLRCKKGIIHVMTCSHRDKCKKVFNAIRRQFNLASNQFRLWYAAEKFNKTQINENSNTTFEQLGIYESCSFYIDVRNPNGSWDISSGKTASSLSIGSGSGFSNLGNTCYINSALQCLCYTTDLSGYLMSQDFLRISNEHNFSNHNLCILFRNLLMDVFNKKVKLFSPREINEMFKNDLKFNIRDLEQQDVTEFLLVFLERLHRELNIAQWNLLNDINSMNLMDPDGTEYWKGLYIGNYSIITYLFNGLLKIRMKCSSCQYISECFEPMNIISLPLPEGHMISISIHVVLCGDDDQYMQCLHMSVNESITIQSLSSMMHDQFKLKSLVFFHYKQNQLKVCWPLKSLNFKEIIAYELDLLKTNKVKLNQLLIVYQRKFTERPMHFCVIDKYRDDLIGVPFVFAKSSIKTVNELYQILLARAKHLLSQVPDNIKLFHLSKITYEGRNCGTCSWIRFCHGCKIDEQSKMNINDVIEDCAIAIDWNLSVAHQYYNFKFATTFESNHSRSLINSSNYINDHDIDQCFDSFFNDSQIDTLLKCSHCQAETYFFQSVSLSRIPPILILQLNRFEKHFGFLEKATQSISFPVDESLFYIKDNYGDIVQYRLTSKSPDNKDKIISTYDLYALICHFGYIKNGHYIAYIRQKDAKNSDWVMHDDNFNQITPSSELETLNEYCYVLFYHKTPNSK